ncbi:MAG: deoxynucleoside kinase, partial [Bacilli bacterium]
SDTGKIIVLEGLDGSGKTTQVNIIKKYLESIGKKVRQVKLPNYENPSSTLVKLYLLGELGSLEEVNAYAVSSFYAVDRYVSYNNDWKTNYLKGDIIVSDRYTTSNIIYQMSKFPKEEWENYLTWLYDFEYQKLGLPQPTMVIYLDMHPNTSESLLEKRHTIENSPQDIHEENIKFLTQARKVALYTAQKQNWKVISCCDGQKPYPIETITKKIIEIIAPIV